MDKVKPKGVVAFATLIIIGSALSLLTIGGTRNSTSPLSFMFYLLVYPVSIVVAIYLLKLKNWARVAIVTISLLVALEMLMSYSSNLENTRAQYSEYLKVVYKKGVETAVAQGKISGEALKAIPKELPASERNAAMQITDAIFMLSVSLSLAFNAGAAIYFSNKNVKKSFA